EHIGGFPVSHDDGAVLGERTRCGLWALGKNRVFLWGKGRWEKKAEEVPKKSPSKP
ncbi:hypothetical protein EVA_07246, partial [gut metagenome]